MTEALKSFKNYKVPGTYGLYVKLLKCVSQKLLICFLVLINIYRR